MKTILDTVSIENFTTQSGKKFSFPLSYELFGKALHTAPVVVVNHALTGNSSVSGETGWWNSLIGRGKTIDSDQYTILCFNIPGNGYDGFLIDSYQDFVLADIASIFLLGLNELKIKQLHLIIGGSIGGAIGWEMLAIQPNITQLFVPIATDYRTSDWLFAQCQIQQHLLESPIKPLEKAREHAMLCYRTPESINFRFKNETEPNKQILKSQDWLKYHGDSLSKRFSLKAYRLMNHLLMTIRPDKAKLNQTTAKIHLVSVDTDLFFPDFEIQNSYHNLKSQKMEVYYHQIKSIHGHDAFLIEYQQLNDILKTILN